jgi:protein SCO1
MRVTPEGRRAFLTGALAAGIGGVAGGLVAKASPSLTSGEGGAEPAGPLSPARAARDRSPFDTIPNVEVWSHDGRKFRFYDDLIKDKVVTLNFFFAECGESCPLITANLRRVQDLFGDRVGRDIFMYSLTLQPERDTPEFLQQYAEIHDIGPGWLLLTGTPRDMERLRIGLGFSDPDPEIDILDDAHTGILRFGNDTLRRWVGSPALARPEGIVYAITTSVLDEGVGRAPQPLSRSGSQLPRKHRDHGHPHNKLGLGKERS